MGTRHEALERIYHDEADHIWRALLGYTGSPDVAAESVAEAFAQALGRGDAIRSARSWVWTAAFKIAAGLLRRRDNAPGAVEGTTVLPDPVVDLVRALSRLPERQRLCVVMHDYADRPVGEIAAVLGITKPTVYAHLRQGRHRLRDILEEEDA